MSTTAVALVAAATAFACVQTIGQLSVKGPGASGTSTANGNSAHPGPKNVEYCVPPTAGATATPRPTGGPNVSITVSFGPATACNPLPPGSRFPGAANQPTDGAYDVNYCNGKVFQDTKNGLLNTEPASEGSCFFSDGVSDAGVLMGQMTVTGGSGSGSFRIPFGSTRNTPNGYAGVSVREKMNSQTSGLGGPPEVNMAPIQMVVL